MQKIDQERKKKGKYGRKQRRSKDRNEGRNEKCKETKKIDGKEAQIMQGERGKYCRYRRKEEKYFKRDDQRKKWKGGMKKM